MYSICFRAESEAAQANSDTSTSWHSANLITNYTVDCTEASRTDASRTDASPSVSRQRSPKRKLKKARRLSSSGDDEYVPPTKQRKQAKHKKRRHKSLKRHKEKRSRHVSTNRKSKKRRTEKDQRTAAKSTAESTASTQLHDVDEASTNQTSKKRRTEKDRRTAAKPTAKATASTQLHDVDEAQHEAESSHIDEQNTKRARSARSKQAQRTAKPKRGRPPIDRQKYYNEFPEIDPALYDTLTRNQFHCRISRLRMLKKLSQNPIAKRSYLGESLISILPVLRT